MYVSADSLEEAVARLRVSAARPALCDFFIVKHAMTQGDGSVTLSLTDETYMSSVRALTAVYTAPGEEPLPPFFNPFGTAREARRGWRTEKYPSNGPPDTVNGPAWKRVIDVVAERPRRVRFLSGYVGELPAVLSNLDGEPPSIEDCATWYHRDRDVDPLMGGDDLRPSAALLEAFVAETGLSALEREAIFGQA